mmetsp:Transcript_38370/g.123139  ORF Transcript_38370/g.123139 Transcript_38370/m.123139 type:complete len:363 (+) Transcript_38370:29-1117(+)
MGLFNKKGKRGLPPKLGKKSETSSSVSDPPSVTSTPRDPPSVASTPRPEEEPTVEPAVELAVEPAVVPAAESAVEQEVKAASDRDSAAQNAQAEPAAAAAVAVEEEAAAAARAEEAAAEEAAAAARAEEAAADAAAAKASAKPPTSAGKSRSLRELSGEAKAKAAAASTAQEAEDRETEKSSPSERELCDEDEENDRRSIFARYSMASKEVARKRAKTMAASWEADAAAEQAAMEKSLAALRVDAKAYAEEAWVRARASSESRRRRTSSVASVFDKEPPAAPKKEVPLLDKISNFFVGGAKAEPARPPPPPAGSVEKEYDAPSPMTLSPNSTAANSRVNTPRPSEPEKPADEAEAKPWWQVW